LNKNENFFFEHVQKKKFEPTDKEFEYFLAKNCHLALRNRGWGSKIRDPGSVIRKKPILDPGVNNKAPDPGSGSAILIYDRQMWKGTERGTSRALTAATFKGNSRVIHYYCEHFVKKQEKIV
jgi:hypothetical protein